jgi:hypothetical protein
MQIRCPLAKKVGVITLNDYKLVFRGVADIEEETGSNVMLGLWKITDQCEAALDRYEGFPHLYGKKVIAINSSNLETYHDAEYVDNIEEAQTQQVMVYQMIDQNIIHRPSQRYLLSIARGCADFGIAKDYIEAALRRSYIEETEVYDDE